MYKKSADSKGFAIRDVAASAFGTQFSNEYNKADIDKFMNANENLTIVHNGHSLQMDAKLPATATDTIAFQLANMGNATYQFVVNAKAYTGLNPYLYDSYTHTTTPIDEVDTVTFTVDTTVSESYQNRFSIVFSPSKESTVNRLPITVYPNPINGNSFNLKLGDAPTGKYRISLVNTLGQNVYNTTLNHGVLNGIETITFNKKLSSGCYVVTATDANGTVLQTQAIIR